MGRTRGRLAALALALALCALIASGETPTAEQFAAEGFESLFNGNDLDGWEGDTVGYRAEGGVLVCAAGKQLCTTRAFSQFVFYFEFKLSPGANNGLGIWMEPGDHAAYDAIELQILDNSAEQYKDIQPYQYHGSIYGIVPAKREHLEPVGEWNRQTVIVKERRITVILNDVVIVDANVDEAVANGAMDHKEHPGLKRARGRIGFLGHDSHLEFRNIWVKNIDDGDDD